MNLTTFLFSFRGRASRKHFWLFLIAYFVVLGAVMVVDGVAAFDPNADEIRMPWLTIAVMVLSIWPAFAVQVKRWHDRNKSAWWLLIQFVPVIGPLWFLIETGFLPGTPTENRFGAPVA